MINMSEQFNIQALNVKDASLQEYQALRKLLDVVHKERQPNDPVVPLEETTISRQRVVALVESRHAGSNAQNSSRN